MMWVVILGKSPIHFSLDKSGSKSPTSHQHYLRRHGNKLKVDSTLLEW